MEWGSIIISFILILISGLTTDAQNLQFKGYRTVTDVAANLTTCPLVLTYIQRILTNTDAFNSPSSRTDSTEGTEGIDNYELVSVDGTFGSNGIDMCLTICKSYAACTAIQYKPPCGGSGDMGTCLFTTSTEVITVQPSTSSTTCDTRSSVLAKRCNDPDKLSNLRVADSNVNPGTDTGTGTGTDTGTGTTDNSSWGAWSSCCINSQTDTNRYRTRECAQGLDCVCTGGTCTNIAGTYTQTKNCPISCETQTINYYDKKCEDVLTGTVFADECNCQKYYRCVHTLAYQRDCSEGTKWNQVERVCTHDLTSQQSNQNVGQQPVTDKCDSNFKGSTLNTYNTDQTCESGKIFGLSDCECVPGPSMAINTVSFPVVLLCDGTPYNANRNGIGSVSTVGEGQLQYISATSTNKVCSFGGASSRYPQGVIMNTLQNIGRIINPTVGLWFKHIPTTNTGQQVLFNYQDRNAVSSMKAYILNSRLYVCSKYISSAYNCDSTSITNVNSNTWYCMVLVFQQDTIYSPKSFSINLYYKSASDASLSSSQLPPSTDYTTMGFVERGAFSLAHEDGPTNQFEGQFDNIYFTKEYKWTTADVTEFCRYAPDNAIYN